MVANFSTIGINYSVITNLTPPDFNLTNQTVAGFIHNLPVNANNLTYDYFGIVVLIIITIYLMWQLSDRSPYGEFQYSTTRSMGIALGMSLTIGIVGLQTGMFTNYLHIGVMLGIYLIILLYTIINNPN